MVAVTVGAFLKQQGLNDLFIFASVGVVLGVYRNRM